MNDCASHDPMTGAVCAKEHGHIGRHGGIDTHGEWKDWI